MKQTKELFRKFDFKLGQAIKQNKLPMVAYYYGKLSALFDLSGRTKENKELCPNWLAWNKFSRSMKDPMIMVIYYSLDDLVSTPTHTNFTMKYEEGTAKVAEKFIELTEESN